MNGRVMTGADQRSSSTATAERAEATRQSAHRPYRRVLIVEDEAQLRRIIARNLTSRGLDVREADCADAAVSAVASERPDLLLLDINLPDRTGWEVLRPARTESTEDRATDDLHVGGSGAAGAPGRIPSSGVSAQAVPTRVALAPRARTVTRRQGRRGGGGVSLVRAGGRRTAGLSSCNTGLRQEVAYSPADSETGDARGVLDPNEEIGLPSRPFQPGGATAP